MAGETVLYVDPDESRREETLERLRAETEDVTLAWAASVEAAQEWVTENQAGCVVTEYDLTDKTGFDLAERIRETCPSLGCVIYTTTDREQLATDDFENTVAEYVDRSAPNAIQQLWNVVEFTSTLRAQTAYPVPQNEQERLAALDAYDFDPGVLEDDFNKITELTVQQLGVSMASVNIINEHTQEFLSSHGADWTSIQREESICTYAIVDTNEVTVIENVQEDPRFEDNEVLRDLGIRSYAGADLTTPEGLTIGTLCAYDKEPRTFSDDDREFLRALADVTFDLLGLHHEVAELRRDAPETQNRSGQK
jgi:CheY-like chemotaxis protein